MGWHIRGDNGQPRRHGFQHDLRPALRMLAEGDKTVRPWKPAGGQLFGSGWTVVVHPIRQGDLFLHWAQQVQLPGLALEQWFRPFQQRSQLVAGQAGDREPDRLFRTWLALHSVPDRIDTKNYRPNVGDIAEGSLQGRLHPLGIGADGDGTLAHHSPQQALHQGESEEFQIGAEYGNQGGFAVRG